MKEIEGERKRENEGKREKRAKAEREGRGAATAPERVTGCFLVGGVRDGDGVRNNDDMLCRTMTTE